MPQPQMTNVFQSFAVWLSLCCFFLVPLLPETCTANDYDIVDTTLQLTAEESAWLKAHPVIHVGIDPSWAPIEFLGKNGVPQGMSVQYLRHMENMLGIHFHVSTGLSWPDVVARLRASKLDLLPAISITAERQKLFNFTKPYLSTPNNIFSAADRAYLGNPDALAGFKVAVVKGYAIGSWLKEKYPKLELVEAPDISTALKMVVNGETYAFIGNLITTSYYIGQTGLHQIKVSGETDFSNELAMAVRKDWDIFHGILQKALDAIPQNQRDAIYADWISIRYEHSFDYTLLWQVLAISALLLFVSMFWNRRLMQEIAHRREVEKALQLARKDAEHATQIKSRFLANMSHELRTPINAIMGLGHLLLKSGLNTEQHGFMEKIQTSSRSLLGIVNNILTFSKGEALKLELEPRTFRLEQLFREVEDTLEPLSAQKQLQLELTIDPKIPNRLVGDVCKLQQILLNLGSNAIKFSETGRIRLSVTQLQRHENRLPLQFTVSDQGMGMTREVQNKLFTPFFQGDSSTTRLHGGTGLGLAISQQLATVMGSRIRVKSEPGKGTLFTFTVEVDIPDSPPESDQSLSCGVYGGSPDTASTLADAHVLLVEDDPLSRLVAEKFLAQLVARVTTVNNGREALEAVKKERFDIILMDIQMPEMDGCEATARIRETISWHHLPIIALTAHAMPGEREKYLAAGMDDYLTKPLNPDELK
ncbi:MAG TPA: transporter substrate-binding domain-containing protein, partial [Gammaproteobacteria bacterium]|nr:transporter substrate-binding domain-containing protein [Gammaproteobacteria bacterium]